MQKIYNTLIVVPMKDPAKSKSRLDYSISLEIKKRLVVKLFKNTLDSLIEATKITKANEEIVVLTNNDQISRLAKNKKINTISDNNAKSLSHSLQVAAEWAEENKFSNMCIIPADLADPNTEDLVKFLSYPVKNNTFVICPSYDLGTNAMFVSPPTLINFMYGKKSFLRHIEVANSAGLNPVVLPLNSLRFDVDTSDDLRELFIKKPNIIE